MNFSSTLIEEAVTQLAKLPGIGKKTALRLALHLLKQDVTVVDKFSDAIRTMRRQIQFCARCHNVSDNVFCKICSSPERQKGIICVVESIRDVIAIESTHQHHGTYHVLGGIISPLDGIGPDAIHIDSLIHRVEEEKITEIIMALSPTLEGDTTTYYISKKLADKSVKITTLSRGVAFGGELEYADELTLARSLQNRLPIENMVNNPS